MARTTLVLDDELLRQLKKKAADEGYSVQRLANDLLRQALTRPPGHPFRLKWGSWKAALQPGVDLSDRDKLYELMEGR
jgi:plasmid stability protein